MAFDDEDTVEDVPSLEAYGNVTAESFDERGLAIAAATHRGRVRSRNEDQYIVVRRSRISHVLATSVPREELPRGDDHAWMLVVADGLGGQVSGEVASATAIHAILKLAGEMSSWIMRTSEGFESEIDERVELYSQAINREMRARAETDPGLAGMATTLTAAYIFGSSAVIVHVGDSRSYLFRGNQMQQITRDHTLAQSLEDKGIPPERARIYTNVLTRCFGTDGDPVRGDVFHLTLGQGDQILLCSDGLTDMVPDPKILRLVTAARSTKDACEKLVAAALDHGGRDNITVVLAAVQ